MAKQHKLNLGDEATSVDSVAGDPTAESRRKYTVLAEGGLFKNGRQYDKGETIELTDATANSFVEIGEIEEST